MAKTSDSWRPGDVTFLGSFPGAPPVTDLPEVAFAGRSNVGKSSAINALLGRKAAARVSKTPGRTQAINLFRIDDRLVFADLPGYGFAKVPEAVQDAWKGAIEAYLGERDALRLVVVLVDARHPPQALDVQLLTGLRSAEIPFLVVATKVDKLKRSQRDRALKALRQGHMLGADQLLPLASPDRVGVGAVWDRLNAACR
jgi:GTP-binding protein